MTNAYDLIVIGGGPAGMASAALASRRGANTLVLDENPGLGGQIYRGSEAPGAGPEVLGAEYGRGAELARDLRESPAQVEGGATVWQLTPNPDGDGLEVGYSQAGAARLVTAARVVLATGALERPFPIPGWTLPGVMTAGAAQGLLKASGTAKEEAVFAGTGPLLYLIAAQYIRAGVPVKAVLDTSVGSNRWRALKHATAAIGRWRQIAKGLKWIDEIRVGGAPILKGVTKLRIDGEDSVTGVTYEVGRKEYHLNTDAVFLHQGVVPNVNLAMAAGCAHHWHKGQLCFTPETGQWLESSVPGIYIAGDGGGIEGAEAAEHQGRVAGLAVLAALGKISEGERNTLGAPHRRFIRAERAFRPFLDALFRPADTFRVPEDDSVTICRCEEVTAAEIKKTVMLGCHGPNQLKSYCRAGMGPCQGRLCGLSVTELISATRRMDPERVGYYRLRPPVKPVTLGELAALAPKDAAE